MSDRDLQRALYISRQRADRLELERVAYEDQIADLRDELKQVKPWRDIAHREAERVKALKAEVERRGNLLEDVVNELDLSETAIAEHGPMGTPPAELVRLMLIYKDKIITRLRAGMVDANELAVKGVTEEDAAKIGRIADFVGWFLHNEGDRTRHQITEDDWPDFLRTIAAKCKEAGE